MSVKKQNKNSIEYSLKRLEEIVELMEQGNVPLDDAMNLYEEGINISKQCADKLKSAELKIKKLSKDVEGKFILEDSEEE